MLMNYTATEQAGSVNDYERQGKGVGEGGGRDWPRTSFTGRAAAQIPSIDLILPPPGNQNVGQCVRQIIYLLADRND